MKQQSQVLARFAVFAAVAEQKSFSLAAERLGLPRSSVSRAIAALEADLGATLFHRTTRKVALSTAGETLLARVSPGLTSLQQAVTAPLVDRSDDRGVIRLTTVADFASVVLADVVAAFVRRYPRIRFDVVLSDRVLDLQGDGIDIAFRFSFGRLKGASLYAKKLGSVQMGLFAAPSYLARAGTPTSHLELHAHAWVTADAMRRSLFGRTRPPTSMVTCNDSMAVRALLLAGVGIGVLPAHLARSEVRAGALVPVLPTWHSKRGTAWLVGAQRTPPAHVQRFREFVLAQADSWF